MKPEHFTPAMVPIALIVQPAIAANNYTTFAQESFNVLQQWYNQSSGLWHEAVWWHSPQCVTVIAELAAIDDTVKSNATEIFENTHTLAPSRNLQEPGNWTNNYFDNQGWWALAWIAAYDVTQNEAYLETAMNLFENTTGAWPTKCFSGGVIWNRVQPQINAITNELFLSVAAHLANRVSSTSKDYYINWALKSYSWMQRSGLSTSPDNLVNFRLDPDTCENIMPSVWAYNQGAIIGGLVELNKAAPNSTYLPKASAIAHAALQKLSDSNGIVHDHCEPNCNLDDCMFKGVFIRNLLKLQEVAPKEDYVTAFKKNADSVWMNDRNENGQFGQNWAKLEGTIYPTTQTSGMDVLIAAAAVC